LNKTTKDIMALSLVDGLGPVKIRVLLENVRDTEEIYSIPEGRIREMLGARSIKTGELRSARLSVMLAEELEYIRREGIEAISCLDEKYPASLRDIYDPPPVVYCKGELLPADVNAVAIVGARRCSLYGLQVAERIASGLAERGITVISGMAKGIDSAAHRGAMRAGGRTIAVLGNGFRHVYPPGSERLFRDICAGGAVITEYASDTAPSKSSFPRRNRIISALAKGVVVVEADLKSGALITADFALEHGKEVFAVPGRIDVSTSRGTNKLIRDGAKPVAGVDDIIEELRLDNVNGAGKQPSLLKDRTITTWGRQETTVMDFLKGRPPVDIDQVSEGTGIGIDRLYGILLRLEMDGAVRALAGARYLLEKENANTI
jgi:DNA processing protein